MEVALFVLDMDNSLAVQHIQLVQAVHKIIAVHIVADTELAPYVVNIISVVIVADTLMEQTLVVVVLHIILIIVIVQITIK